MAVCLVFQAADVASQVAFGFLRKGILRYPEMWERRRFQLLGPWPLLTPSLQAVFNGSSFATRHEHSCADYLSADW